MFHFLSVISTVSLNSIQKLCDITLSSETKSHGFRSKIRDVSVWPFGCAFEAIVNFIILSFTVYSAKDSTDIINCIEKTL